MANVMNPTVAPAPLFPEVAGNIFERTMGPDIPGQRGSLRFEEGVATDTDVPNDFAIGSYVDTSPVPGRPNHNNPAMSVSYTHLTLPTKA